MRVHRARPTPKDRPWPIKGKKGGRVIIEGRESGYWRGQSGDPFGTKQIRAEGEKDVGKGVEDNPSSET